MSGEMGKRPTVGASPAQKPKASASFAKGDRVRHAIFGTGEIVSARQMGGDTLYEVRFDNGEIKKLMATYAKLTLA
jgi:DNA helicase-2/ATP-dependent DNA helicase PcrA